MTTTREELVYQFGTCRRGHGAAIHAGHRSFRLDENGRETYVSVGAACNSNGQMAGRDFQEGNGRPVTCRSCRPTSPASTPSERTPKADSCTALNKKTGKQCTFKGWGEPRRCNTHRHVK